MITIVHMLAPGEECTDTQCSAMSEHMVRTPEPEVTLWKTTWKTRDGRVLDVSEMGPRHALHTYHLLHRQARRLAWNTSFEMIGSPWAPRGDMAQDAFDRELQEMHEYPHRWLDQTTLVRALWARACEGFPVEI